MIQQIVIMIATALLTALFTGLFIKWQFQPYVKGISTLTHLGGRVAGEASGAMRATRAVRENFSEQLLNGSSFSGLRILARQFGVDIESMIEEHGAEETLTGIIQIAQMFGIDPQKLLIEGIGGVAKGLLGKGNLKIGKELP